MIWDALAVIAALLANLNWEAIGGVTFTALGAVVALVAFRYDRRRALANHREELRGALREWFATLSRTAPRRVRVTGPALRARIEEVADAHDFEEIFVAMRWAQDMHQATFDLADQQCGHHFRIIVKRRFRQFIALWSVSRRRGRRLMLAYAARGWQAILEEPDQSIDSVRRLARPATWRRLPKVWSAAD